MATFKDLNRLLNGLSLVAKEIAIRSPILESAKNGDVPSLIQSTAKNALVSVTNLSGLTKGSRRRINPESANPRVRESVVCFDQEEISQVNQNQEVSSVSCDSVTSDSVKAVETESHCSYDSVTSSHEVVETERNERIVEIAGNTVEVVVGEREQARPQVERAAAATEVKRRRPRERRVPSTPFSRAIGFAGLGAGLAWGTLQESARRLVYGAPKEQQKQSALSPFLNEKNAERLALALCRMRGAALKIGQMLSIQDESLVPAPILAALDIVRQGADVMPRKQLNQVLNAELGPNWQSKLSSFDYDPMAAASIGQVHRAVTRDGLQVAMKIQYPGVADSIDSDIENVKLLLDYTKLIPEGLYLDRAMKVAKQELSRECDYELEAKNQKRFRDLLSPAQGFYVPLVLDNLSSKRVLTTELVSGIPIDKVALLNQDTRNYVGTKLLEITLMELFVFRFMQTDPNWSNFLYDEAARSFNLIDFGAARDYPKSFVDNYLRMVIACANGDRDAIIEMSQKLGFLTGKESEIMLDAHVQAGLVVGLPFSKPGGFNFRTTNITQSISNLGATMLRHRLTPPPDEAYSLHRKLSGAFLACMKLGSVVPCRELLIKVYEHYRFGDGEVDGETAGVLSAGLLS